MRNNLNYLVLLFLIALIFILDLVTPIGTADGIGYIAVVLFTIRIEKKESTILCVFGGIILTCLGYALSPTGDNSYLGLANRILSIGGIITAGFIIIKYKEAIFLVNDQKRLLEKQVHDRTAALENTLHELKVALEHQEEANMLKSRFISTVSHEFRTPLATIQSSVFLISKYGEQGNKVKEAAQIAKINGNIKNLTDLLDDVLLVSRQEEKKVSANFEDLNIPKSVYGITDEMNVLLKEGQKIQYNHTGNHIFIFDNKSLTHIVQNLLSNAIKFSAPGQPIKVATEVKEGMLSLTVEDNGIGIPEADQKHLYERFFRAHNTNNIKGTGLGLHIVFNYVRIHGGKIQCFSELGKGTRFEVQLASVQSSDAL